MIYLLLSNVGEGLPDVCKPLNHFKDAFDWVEANNSGRIMPREGVDTEYDSACKMVKEIESSLMQYLKEQRKLLEDKSVSSLGNRWYLYFRGVFNHYLNVVIYLLQISYITVGKEAYLLEVPESLCGNIPLDYELRSSRKVRNQTLDSRVD